MTAISRVSKGLDNPVILTSLGIVAVEMIVHMVMFATAYFEPWAIEEICWMDQSFGETVEAAGDAGMVVQMKKERRYIFDNQMGMIFDEIDRKQLVAMTDVRVSKDTNDPVRVPLGTRLILYQSCGKQDTKYYLEPPLYRRSTLRVTGFVISGTLAGMWIVYWVSVFVWWIMNDAKWVNPRPCSKSTPDSENSKDD